MFNDKFALEDNSENMIQKDGFNLKLSFYSKDAIQPPQGVSKVG